nr:hypothetical protein [Tanacetum cinerariifolium]
MNPPQHSALLVTNTLVCFLVVGIVPFSFPLSSHYLFVGRQRKELLFDHGPKVLFISNCFECYFDKCDIVCWKNLKSLSITYGRLHEDLIQNILSGSPLLETLVLEDCCGFERLDITNKCDKNLVISGELDGDNVDSIIINAPYILSLTIEDHVSLMKPLLLNVSSVIQVELDYSIKRHFQLKEMYKDQEMNEELLKRFILSLSHVKELKIGKLCSKKMKVRITLLKKKSHNTNSPTLISVKAIKPYITEETMNPPQHSALLVTNTLVCFLVVGIAPFSFPLSSHYLFVGSGQRKELLFDHGPK